MGKNKNISNSVIYIGVDDNDIDLFENQYKVPNGISYNSYLIKDEKIVIMDTVDKRKTEEWIKNLEQELDGKNPDYLVISHLEPDHSGSLEVLLEKYPNIKLVGNEKTFSMLPQFVDFNIEEKTVKVSEGDILEIGKHKLQFFMAPMVHWPEVMVTYEQKEKILFSADGFGTFGTTENREDWESEARRYYFNIVGKYGMQVQMLLKKLSTIEVKMICSLHGPILKENLEFYINKYNLWSSYTPENEGVLIACASIHGNTMEAAKKLKEMINKQYKIDVVVRDLAREDVSKVIEEAFYYDKLILMGASYNMKVFPPMQNFLSQLEGKNYQKRKISIIENGSWAPSAAKTMKEVVDKMKNIDFIEPIITIKTRMNNENIIQMEQLIKNIIKF